MDRKGEVGRLKEDWVPVEAGSQKTNTLQLAKFNHSSLLSIEVQIHFLTAWLMEWTSYVVRFRDTLPILVSVGPFAMSA